MSLVPGGLYVFLTMRADVGDCHWGLYLHHSTQTVDPKHNGASDSLFPQRKQRIIHRGKKYHVRNLGEGYMPDHQVVGDILSTLFLVGLLRIGVIHGGSDLETANKTITTLDHNVHNFSEGNSIYCRTWVVGIIRKLVNVGLLQTNATDEAVWVHVESFGQKEWQSAEKAIQPRPIVTSTLFV